ncbi:MAG: hypothetical protein CSB03_00260 [Bacteroidia bacterium]|nr:MAG: hypothetical protein CSB03_00260 [Bacteroidia bacterium]
MKGQTNFEKVIDEAIANQDSVGGIVSCKAENLPVGWGEPFFDSIESVVSHLAFAVPAIKGIVFGSGFEATEMWGSEHNDTLENKEGKTNSNNSGGVNGGISNGNTLEFRVAVKPTSSISKVQHTLNVASGDVEELQIQGRHDACIALRVPVVIEAITAMALADFKLIRKTQL